jgi:hypothetical protein
VLSNLLFIATFEMCQLFALVHLAEFSAIFPRFFASTLLTDILVNQRANRV